MVIVSVAVGAVPDSSPIGVVLGRQGRAQTAVDQHDDDGDRRLGQRNRASGGTGVFSRLIGRQADRGGARVLMSRSCGETSLCESKNKVMFTSRLV